MKALGYIDIKEEKKGVEHITELKVDNLPPFKVGVHFPKKQSTFRDLLAWVH